MTPMKNLSYFLPLFFFCLFSCNSFEEDHLVKEEIREHLNRTLHNPDSFEELEWSILRDYQYTDVDSTNPDSPLKIDHMATIKFDEENGERKFIELIYRAENGFGALRKGSLYAVYFEDDKLIQFEDGAYSIELESYLPNPETAFRIDPKELYLREQYYMINDGSGTYEGFLQQYPEFD